MTSTCTLFNPGESITDPQTGEVTSQQETVWFGPCYVRPSGEQGVTTDIDGAEAFIFDYLISVPFEVTTAAAGQRITITSSPDPALVGITAEVQRVSRGDDITRRRLFCRDVA
jgi:hypothetical protein